MIKLPENYNRHVDEILDAARGVEGFLTDREMRFLVLLGACPSAEGSILEIGSFKGRSSIILSKSAAMAGDPSVSAIDPLTSPAETDPDLMGKKSVWDDFQENLKQADVFEHIDFHQTTSEEAAKIWDRKLRLLWIDGDHTYKGVKADFDNFVSHLSDRGIIAMHDVLNQFDGGIRVFTEDILMSDHFGPCGFVGAIGWAQYFADSGKTTCYQKEKERLNRCARRLIPYLTSGRALKGFRKLVFKYLRAIVPHKEIDPEEWLKKIQPIQTDE